MTVTAQAQDFFDKLSDLVEESVTESVNEFIEDSPIISDVLGLEPIETSPQRPSQRPTLNTHNGTTQGQGNQGQGNQGAANPNTADSFFPNRQPSVPQQQPPQQQQAFPSNGFTWNRVQAGDQPVLMLANQASGKIAMVSVCRPESRWITTHLVMFSESFGVSATATEDRIFLLVDSAVRRTYDARPERVAISPRLGAVPTIHTPRSDDFFELLAGGQSAFFSNDARYQHNQSLSGSARAVRPFVDACYNQG